ncbi:VanZ family protein [Ruminococcus sp. OA3]|uniref:VanZ family protein n=1 Tax=Ruminococcus sp. OA3 TaxID=2914164 RepID=UPI001F059987|nr:VanZ family protein [Ruminococcus sp. OA3]MCH1984082.1 VanZ family protein [Ruminococcus sp. OA3]
MMLENVLMYLLPGITVWAVYLAVFEVYLRVSHQTVTLQYRAATLLLAAAMTAVFSMTVSPVFGFTLGLGKGQINLIPGQVLRDIGDNPLNFFGNILMFIPLGFLLPMLSRKFQKVGNAVLFCAGTSLLIEVLQLFLTRGTDIDDLILNTLGGLIGFLAAMMLLAGVRKLYGATGIRDQKTGKIKKRDGKPVLILVVLMLIGVMGTGLWNCRQFAMPQTQAAGHDLTEETNDWFDDIGIEAKNACLIDAREGNILYGKEENQQIAPASTAKILTVLTAARFCAADEEVTVGEEINRIESDASRAWLVIGQRLSVKQLMEGMLLPSGNDAAYVLAVYAGRKIKDQADLSIDRALEIFMDKMNETAVLAGAENSRFLRPDGYDADGQYTTAYDLACCARVFMNTEYGDGYLSDIVRQPSIRTCFADGTDVTWQNTNQLLSPESTYYDKTVVGLKTGSSDAAGKCLVSAAYRNERLYITVVMGDSEEGRYQDTLDLLNKIEG